MDCIKCGEAENMGAKQQYKYAKSGPKDEVSKSKTLHADSLKQRSVKIRGGQHREEQCRKMVSGFEGSETLAGYNEARTKQTASKGH